MSTQPQTTKPRMGMNRTGLATSPMDSERLVRGATELQPAMDGSLDGMIGLDGMIDMRMQYIAEADPLGSVPPPATMSGAITTGIKMISGNSPQPFLDKLSERLAFERGGTRLYDALITKFNASTEVTAVSLNELKKNRADEAQHVQLVIEAITKMGGDPTAQTPSADLVGVETMGLMQAVNDPRTSFADCLHAMLTAELADVEGWMLLATLADGVGEEELAGQFRDALLQENDHLQKVRAWHQAIVLNET